MLAALRYLWIAPFVALSTAALAQATSGTSAGTARLPGGATSSIGLPTVPNNSLPPLPASTASDVGTTAATPGLTPTTPALTAPIPGLGTTTTSPQATTPGVIIQLPPPSPGLSSSPGPTRTCPSGTTFC